MLGRKKTPHALSDHLKNYCIDISVFGLYLGLRDFDFPFFLANINVFISSRAGYTRLAYVCLQSVEFLPADFQLRHHGRRRQIVEGDGAGKTKLLNAPFSRQSTC